MKKRIMLALPLVVAGAAILSLAGTTTGEKPAPAPAMSAMQTEVSDLKAQVQSLESRLKSLESTVSRMQQPHLVPLVTPDTKSIFPPAAEPQPPKVWGEREINGWKFYIVPCDQSGQNEQGNLLYQR
jgi:hypothetical protein